MKKMKTHKIKEMYWKGSNLIKKLAIRCYGGTRFQDWFRGSSLSNVVSLKLKNCKYCFSLPPLGKLPSLKELSISGFDGVVVIGSEFHCNGFKSIVPPFPSLEVLKFEDMLSWEEWYCSEREDEDKGGTFPCLQKLYIRNCPKLKWEIPKHSPCLTKLVLNNCGKLQLNHLPSTLTYFKLGGSGTPDCLLRKILLNNPKIERLHIQNCQNVELPMCHYYASLGWLQVEVSCNSPSSFSLGFFPKLQNLTLVDDKNLGTLSGLEEQESFLTSLTKLEIWNCPKFISFPKGGLSSPKLEILVIAHLENLKSLPEKMHILLPSLRELLLQHCPLLESFPEGSLPSNLNKLEIYYCPKLIASRKGWDLHRLNSLKRFSFSDEYVEYFPDEGLLPTNLYNLTIRGCSNLKSVLYVGLLDLTSLVRLFICDCPSLQCLPEEGLPGSLSILDIRGDSPLLKQRCQKEKGEDWHKIAHLAIVQIDAEIIT